MAGYYDLVMDENSSFSKTLILKDSEGVAINITGFTIEMNVWAEDGELLATYSNLTSKIVNGGSTGSVAINLTSTDVNVLRNGYYKLVVTNLSNEDIIVLPGLVFIRPEVRNNVSYLSTQLRLTIGDINPLAYRYTDEWLQIALIGAVKSLGRWWGHKYIVDSEGTISRNANLTFDYDSPPIIQAVDERPIILMAATILLEGSLESNAYDLASWKDAEVSFTNLEMGRIKDSNLKRLWDELTSLISPPKKRLARTVKGSLPGYLGNSYERNSDY